MTIFDLKYDCHIMGNWKLMFVFLLLMGGSTNFLFSSELPKSGSENTATSYFAEDFQELSPSRLSNSTIDFLNYRFSSSCSTAIPTEEKWCDYSRSKAYFSSSRFIKPGLSLTEIIFPFHFFQ